MFRDAIEPGTEYYESLMRFIEKEQRAGKITRTGYSTRTCSLMLLALSVVLVLFGNTAIHYGVPLTIAAMCFSISIAFLSFTIRQNMAKGMFRKFTAIEQRFTQEALVRLTGSGVPEDVQLALIARLRQQHCISYSELFDIYWLCSRRASGADNGKLIYDRYTQLHHRNGHTSPWWLRHTS